MTSIEPRAPASAVASQRALDTKPRRSRTKRGCLCCRLRRKKCDECWPVCAGCTRNNLICSWPYKKSTLKSVRRTSDLGWRVDLQSGQPFYLQAQLPTGSAAPVCIRLNPQAKASSFQLLDLLQTRLRRGTDVPQVVPFASHRRLCGRDDLQTLLEHFVRETAPLLVGTTAGDNPLLKYVLPRAVDADTPLLDAILAISGAQFSFCTGNAAFMDQTLQCYSQAVTQVLAGVSHWAVHTPRQNIDLLTASMLLYQYEAIAGSKVETAYHHLSASREFIVRALNSDVKGDLKGDDQELMGFLLEFYAYLTVVNNLTVTVPAWRQRFMSDWFVRSLGHLTKYGTFGSMLGCGSQLYEYVIAICLVQNDRPLDRPSAVEFYTRLEREILQWKPVLPATQHQQPQHSILTCGRVFQQAVLIFLHTWYCRNFTSEASAQRKVADHVGTAIRLLATLDRHAPIRTTLLWPYVVIGVWVHSPKQRHWLRENLEDCEFQLPIVQRAINLLERVWERGLTSLTDLVALEGIVEATSVAMS